MSCSVGRRHGSDTELLWLWCILAASALIRPLAWELHMLWVQPQREKKEREREREKERKGNERQREKGEGERGREGKWREILFLFLLFSKVP